ncbi:MAG: cell division protein ZapA [Spirochaetaceae bacterium]|jgi:cell division protein ZapA (FtsZ GTPase activity inhibitor)|nr:cell division protein ZapA [Spirochaetaceae bacterium]
MSKSDLRFDILGTSFSILADEDPAYLESLLNRYRMVIENTQKSTGITDPLKIAILAGFLLCDELRKTRRREGFPEDPETREAERLTLDLIARIDEVLENTTS